MSKQETTKDSSILIRSKTPDESGFFEQACTADQAFAVEMLGLWMHSRPSQYRTEVSAHQKRFAMAVQTFLEEARVFKTSTGG